MGNLFSTGQSSNSTSRNVKNCENGELSVVSNDNSRTIDRDSRDGSGPSDSPGSPDEPVPNNPLNYREGIDSLYNMKSELNKINREVLLPEDLKLYDQFTTKFNQFFIHLLKVSSDDSEWITVLKLVMKKYKDYPPESFQQVLIDKNMLTTTKFENHLRNHLDSHKLFFELLELLNNFKHNLKKNEEYYINKIPGSRDWFKALGGLILLVFGLGVILYSKNSTVIGGALAAISGAYFIKSGLTLQDSIEDKIEDVRNSIQRMEDYLVILKSPIIDHKEQLNIFKQLCALDDPELITYECINDVYHSNLKLKQMIHLIVFGKYISEEEYTSNRMAAAAVASFFVTGIGL